jgi:D-ribulokinase
MLAAVSSGAFGSLQDAMASMSEVVHRYQPAQGRIAELHERRFRSFEKLQQTALAL